MSSSNEIDIVYVPEAVYGETPAGVDFETVRKTSDNLSGTPNVVQSEEARADRQSGGQALVGLNVGGPIGYQLSASKCFDDFLEAGMMTPWIAEDGETIDMDINTAGAPIALISRTGGDFTAKITAGDWIELAGFTDAENNIPVFVLVSNATSLTVIGRLDMVTDAASTGTSYKVSQHTRIGVTRSSFSMEKQFTDINKFIAYTGMRVAGFNLNTQVNGIINGSFSFAGNGYAQPATSIAAAETTNPAGSAGLMNASVDMGTLVVDGAAVTYCIESINLTLDNSILPQECIGRTAPADQIPFEAAVSIDMVAHLSAANFALIQNKLSQEPISIAYYVRDENGDGYAVHLPEVQLSFDDPGMPGKNQHVMLNMSGVAKYAATEANTMFLYRLGL